MGPGHRSMGGGWQATVNGREQAVSIGNLVFRAVPVAKGINHLRFVYRPFGHPWFWLMSWTAPGVLLCAAQASHQGPMILIGRAVRVRVVVSLSVFNVPLMMTVCRSPRGACLETFNVIVTSPLSAAIVSGLIVTPAGGATASRLTAPLMSLLRHFHDHGNVAPLVDLNLLGGNA